MSVVAAVRPDSWNFPLLVHVLGAMILVGGLVASAGLLAYARGEAKLLRLGYWSLLVVSVPGWVLLRIGAAWISSREGWDDVPSHLQPSWLGIGFLVADGGAVVLLLALILGGVGLLRLRAGGGAGLLKATLVLSTVLLAADLVAVWAMAGKPS
jgi:hypothetical protein